MIEVGRICVKTAGRDSNRYCVVVDKIDDNYVMIEGDVRKRKVNIKHLEPTKKKVDAKKDSSKEKCIELIIASGFKVKTQKKRITKAVKNKKEEKVKSVETKKEEKPKAKPVKKEKPKSIKTKPVKKEAKKE